MNAPPAREIIAALRNLVAFHKQIGIATYPRSKEIDALLSPVRKENVLSPPVKPRPQKSAPPRRPAPAKSPGLTADLAGLTREINACRNCPRHNGRLNPVASGGDTSASLMVVVDYPVPADEAAGGHLSGERGELFDRMLAAIGLDRKRIFLTAMTRCSPGADRPPNREECLACQPWLLKEIRIIRPRVILAMGAATAAILTGKNAPLSSLRGRLLSYAGIAMIASHPPAVLLEQAELKQESWHDLKMIRDRLR